MAIRNRLVSLQFVVGIPEVPNFGQVQRDARELGPLAASVDDVLGKRTVLRQVGRTYAVSLIPPEVIASGRRVVAVQGELLVPDRPRKGVAPPAEFGPVPPFRGFTCRPWLRAGREDGDVDR
jgi:hypothetical protein